MSKISVYRIILLLCALFLMACGDSDDDGDISALDSGSEAETISITSDELPIVNADGSISTYVYGQGETPLADPLPDGGSKPCFCQRLNFRAAQALVNSKTFSDQYPHGLPEDGFRIVTRWNTEGAEELFVDALGWPENRVRIAIDATSHNELTLDDAVFYFIPESGDTAWKVSARESLFPPDFFTLRTAAKKGGTTEKSAFAPVMSDAMSNYLGALPVENGFVVESVVPETEGPGLAPSLTVFAGWEGQWNSAAAYLDDPEMADAYQAVADAAPGHDADDVSEFLADMYATDFAWLDIQVNAIAFCGIDAVTGATVKQIHQYRDAGTETVAWGDQEVVWQKFEAESGSAGQPYLIFTQVHSHGGIAHWHMRFGSEGFDALINHADPLWWPTLFPADTTSQEVSDELTGEAEAVASMLPSGEAQ